MRLYDEEPEASDWQPVPVAAVVSAVLGDRPSGRRAVLAVDGRSSSGKTTFAAAIEETTERAITIHTDDLLGTTPSSGGIGCCAKSCSRPRAKGEPSHTAHWRGTSEAGLERSRSLRTRIY